MRVTALKISAGACMQMDSLQIGLCVDVHAWIGLRTEKKTYFVDVDGGRADLWTCCMWTCWHADMDGGGCWQWMCMSVKTRKEKLT